MLKKGNKNTMLQNKVKIKMDLEKTGKNLTKFGLIPNNN